MEISENKTKFYILSKRIDFLDIIKGIGIILVVVGHI
jgi:uncharacterized membrane protein YcfT